jgi:hypothetical protein
MKQRGKKSAESVELNVIEGDFGGKRPDPPAELTPRQAEHWKLIVDDEPVDCFSTAATRNMLKDLCVQRQITDTLVETINTFPHEGMKSTKGMVFFRQLQKAHDMSSRNAASLATKLRLTNQSRYTPKAAFTASQNSAKGIKPWDWEK